MVIAYHLTWTGYGWWLPNDPRGSTSRTISIDVIAELGELHFGRKKVQPPSREIRDFYERAREVLKYGPRAFTSRETKAIAEGLAEAIGEHRYTCYACAVMPDDVHILIRKHKHKAEEMIVNLQRASRVRLNKPASFSPDRPAWSTGGWKMFLDHPDEVRRTIRYMQDNPIKQRLPLQEWDFVKEYDGWPLHPGHNPNSPYARRLRNRYRRNGC